jgi:transposase-like protein
MTIENVIRVSLAMVLVWQIWFLHVRGRAGWKQLRKGKQGKQRKQSREKKEQKPFEGLTRRPVCELCEAEAEKQEREGKQEPPPKIERERGRQREVDTSKHFCPEKECRYHGWLGRENIVSNGHPSGGRWRQLKCVVCGKHFQKTIGTVFYGSSVLAEDIIRALVALCEGVSPRKVARIFGVDKDTLLIWLVEAAIHSEAVIRYVVHNLHLTQVQMDESYALLSEMREEGEERGRCWVWAAIDPISKLLLAIEVGDRGLDMAQRLVHGVVSVLAPGVVRMFLTNQLAAYGKAWLTISVTGWRR